MYGATFGNIDGEENFLDYESSMQNQGVLLLNPDALQSQLLLDYMDVEDTNIFELLENLKDPEFIAQHSAQNPELSSFGFPNIKRGSTNLVSKMKYLK